MLFTQQSLYAHACWGILEPILSILSFDQLILTSLSYEGDICGDSAIISNSLTLYLVTGYACKC